MTDQFSKTAIINAGPSAIWKVLTDPHLMSLWMGEPETNVKVFTTWQIDSPILVTGFHHGDFENRGSILHYDEARKLVYTHLSSTSQLADVPESYSIFEFVLVPESEQTKLTITIKNFPTDVIRKHLELYWGATIQVIKDMVEKSKHDNSGFAQE